MATLYKYIGVSGLDHPTLHFPNINDFLNNGKQSSSSDSTASFLNSKTSSGIEDSSKRIFLRTEESIASLSLQSFDVIGVNMDDDETNSGSIDSDGCDSYNIPKGIFHHQHNGRHWVHNMYRKLKTPLKSGNITKYPRS